MFRISNFYQEVDMTWERAKGLIENMGNGDLLAGMEAMDAAWEEHCKDEDAYDDDFADNYGAEMNAFNIVFKTFKPLFA